MSYLLITAYKHRNLYFIIAFRYTMDSERQLHEQHVGSGEPDVAEAEGRPDRSEPSEISGPAGDDLGDNVELF